MATFLMIHGAWHDGHAFDPLRAGLEARGHALLAPTLPGIGGDDVALAAVTLPGWADFVADLARRQAGPVILCGHSRGGIVISEAAERAPEAIAALVYITAFLIPSGRMLNDLVAEAPRIPEFDAGLSPVANGAALAITPTGALATFYHRAPAEAARAACARLTPEPVAPFVTPLALTDARYGRVPRHYIECTEDRAIPLAQQHAMQAALPCASVTTLESDHSPFLTCPGTLVEALNRIGEGPHRRWRHPGKRPRFAQSSQEDSMKLLATLSAATLFALPLAAPAALPIGATAPDFSTQAAHAGKPFPFVLKDALRKGPVVLYFFPAAFTPGCTIEAHNFAEASDEFRKAGATLVGMSADPIAKLQEFSVKECSSKFAVGSATPAMIAGYDVKLAKTALTDRTSYVISPEGKIIFAYSAMNPAGHVKGTLAAVKQWEAAHRP